MSEQPEAPNVLLDLGAQMGSLPDSDLVKIALAALIVLGQRDAEAPQEGSDE